MKYELLKVEYPDIFAELCKIADITFNVWYRLSEELLKLNDTTMSEEFKPYIQRLIICLCSHCQLDEDTSPVSYTTES